MRIIRVFHCSMTLLYDVAPYYAPCLFNISSFIGSLFQGFQDHALRSTIIIVNPIKNITKSPGISSLQASRGLSFSRAPELASLQSSFFVLSAYNVAKGVCNSSTLWQRLRWSYQMSSCSAYSKDNGATNIFSIRPSTYWALGLSVRRMLVGHLSLALSGE